MSFQFVGFLLTYLLASTHAARCGSRVGLGVILIQYGFYVRDSNGGAGESGLPIADTDGDFQDPTKDDSAQGLEGTLVRNQWISGILMIFGWFILVRSLAEYYRVKTLEAQIRQTSQQSGDGASAVIAAEEGDAVV